MKEEMNVHVDVTSMACCTSTLSPFLKLEFLHVTNNS